MTPFFFFFQRERMHTYMCLAGPHEKGEREKVKSWIKLIILFFFFWFFSVLFVFCSTPNDFPYF
jgi:hypothetical protein